MNDPEEWAKAVRMASRLEGNPIAPVRAEDPSSLVRRVTNNVTLCGGPIEYFSTLMPVWLPPSSEDRELVPIDILYGKYNDATASIDIYLANISRDATSFGGGPDELLDIVRIHEHAHAVLHLGVTGQAKHAALRDFGSGTATDWGKFRSWRDTVFRALNEESHELLAQAITWTCLVALEDKGKSERLQAVFQSLETKQRSHYRLPTSLKTAAVSADWPLVLEAARGSFLDVASCSAAGLRALIRQTAENST